MEEQAMPIQILEDLLEAFEDYPHEYLMISIEVDPNDIPGSIINVGDVVPFRLRIRNDGPLDMNELNLTVSGVNGTEVLSNGSRAQWGDEFDISGEWNGDFLGHMSESIWRPNDTGGKFKFRPTRQFGENRADLVKVEVKDWRSDWSHYERAHTRADPAANDTYRSTVVAS
jgi:hypothetical protein